MNMLKQTGWILLIIGALAFVYLLLEEMVGEFFLDPQIPILAKVGVVAVTVGFIALLASLVIERLEDKKKEHDHHNN